MESNNKLQTNTSSLLYNFLKSHLHNFYPGSIIKEGTKNSKPLKASFHYIIRTMAGESPDFLTSFIYQKNPTINEKTKIPFEIREKTLKLLIHKFTTILFTKLNYAEIFASAATIPPYKPENRLQFCLNLARIHLYLSDNYQAINYNKFAEDLNLRPKTYNLYPYTVSTDKAEKYLTIKHDNKFNINLLFNIPKSLFFKNFSIPSLNNSLDHFKEWFEQFFPIYNRQFTNSLDKEQTFNTLKKEIRKKFISQLRNLLPIKFIFREPYSFQERRNECFRSVNYHILTCKHTDCTFINENHQYDTPKLFKHILDNSFESFPKKTFNIEDLHIDESIFHINSEHKATFDKPFPTKLLDKLADEAEALYCSDNLAETREGRRNAFFYKYLISYQQVAAQNHDINNLTKDLAIDKITNEIIDTDFLARIITYFDLIKDKQPSFSQIVNFYKTNAYPEAEKLLITKFNINFQIPSLIEESLFLKETPFQ